MEDAAVAPNANQQADIIIATHDVEVSRHS